MKQDADLDALVRQRIRGLRTSLGWSLDELAARSYLSPSTLSRIETGHRRIALDQLTPIAKLRVTRKVPARLRVHPGRDWFTVLSGTIVLRLGERTILVRAGEAAE